MATAKTATGSSQKSADTSVSAAEIEQNIERIRNDIAALAGSLKTYGAGKTDEYKARAASAGDDLTRKSQEALDELTAQLQSYERALGSHVRRHPLQALGIAAGIGFLVATLVRR